MKKIIFAALTIAALALPAGVAAAPFNAADKNPQVVAYYPTGIHAIAGNPITYHEGADLVKRNGASGNFQQWYQHPDGWGIHSVWKDVGSQTTCSKGWVFIAQANPGWGDYLTAGANYCVHNNYYGNR
jgi:hypothetical protein